MKLSIQNFQAIKKQTLELKGFTVLEGKSDCGKSSVRRALDSLLFNNWDNSYLRDGARSCILTLTDDKGNTITQTKGSENSYNVSIDGKTKYFDKVGIDTPDLVKSLGFSMFETSSEAYNPIITTQLESLYMVSYRPVENTRILNTLFDIDLFGVASSLSVSDINSTNRSIKQAETERDLANIKLKQDKASIKSLKANLDSTSNLLDWITVLSNREQAISFKTKAEKSLKRVNNRLANVDYFLSSLTCLYNHNLVSSSIFQSNKELTNIQLKSRLLDIGSRLEQVSKLMLDRSNCITSIDRLKNQRDTFTSKSKLLSVLDKLTLLKQQAVVQFRSSSLLESQKKVELYEQLLSIQDQLNILKKRETVGNSIEQLNKKALVLGSDLEETLKALSEFEVCPTCGSHIKGISCL